ncbi:MAG: orotate phosphoribosyltransferase, partial [Bdellovibrionales bacterium]|nr:orotate phosphoribosyltransferase [Bdellovibrionales bacterium]NQZ20117.1 orotate phosphoribosyltransferase [Bdellovibrionales bacterium]
MDKAQLAKEVFNVAHLTGEFLLRSGKVSNEYFDKYQFSARPKLLKAIAQQMIPLLPDNFDLLGAMEMGGIPLASAISLETGKEIVFIRKEAKKYGTSKFAEGPDVEGKT